MIKNPGCPSLTLAFGDKTNTAADTSGKEIGERPGSFSSNSVWLQHGGQLGPVDVAAYVRVGSTEGYKKTISADRKRAAGDLRPDIADYTIVDLVLRTANDNGRWSLCASLRNMFNADVREPSPAPGTVLANDLPMAPRFAYLQAIYRL